MSRYIDLELSTLMDLLVKHTEEYTKMVTYKVFSVEEFSHCKQQLGEIQAAIKEKNPYEGRPQDKVSPKTTDSNWNKPSSDLQRNHSDSHNPN